MKSAFNKFKKIFNIIKFKKVPWILGLHAFWIILILIFVDFSIGGYLFYKYIFLVEKEEIKIITSLKFKKTIYEKILKEWETKNQRFEEYQTEQYLNPFIVIKTKETTKLIQR